MRTSTKVCAALVALWLCRWPSAGAQRTEWETLNDEVKALYKQGRYARAIVVAKEALKVAERTFGPDHPNVATSLNNLAMVYDELGQYAKAEPLYKRALAIREKALGPDPPDVATSLEILAGVLRQMDRTDEARKYAERAARIRRKSP